MEQKMALLVTVRLFPHGAVRLQDRQLMDRSGGASANPQPVPGGSRLVQGGRWTRETSTQRC